MPAADLETSTTVSRLSFRVRGTMTSAQFRRLALRLPRAVEKSHMGHPDFRVAQKIFATLGYPDSGWAMAKLTPEQQQQFVERDRQAFTPLKGAWGRRGSTDIRLNAASVNQVKAVLNAAWRNAAPKELIKKRDLTSDRCARSK